MKTRIVKLNNGDKQIVLCGAIHIGTQRYFDNLNSIADESDVVLFEGVKASTLDNLKVFYAKLGELVGLSVQNRTGYENSPKWKNSDMNYEIIKSYIKKSPLKESKLVENVKNLEELINEEDETLRKFARWIILFIIKRLTFISKFVRRNYVLVDLRNYNLLVDIVKNFESYSSVSVVYGEGHLNHLIKNLKKMNFEVVEISYLESLN